MSLNMQEPFDPLRFVPLAREDAATRAAKRQAMIAVAAYFHAERRGFAPGHDVEDWIAAEQEVDTLLQAAALPLRSHAA